MTDDEPFSPEYVEPNKQPMPPRDVPQQIDVEEEIRKDPLIYEGGKPKWVILRAIIKHD